MQRARARAQFQSNCDALSELGEIFSSASNIADMGKATLKEMDRVFCAVAASEQQKAQQDSARGNPNVTNVSSTPQVSNFENGRSNSCFVV